VTNPFRCWFDTPQLNRALERAGLTTPPSPQTPHVTQRPPTNSTADKPRFGLDTSSGGPRPAQERTPALVPAPNAPPSHDSRTQPRGTWPTSTAALAQPTHEPVRPPTPHQPTRVATPTAAPTRAGLPAVDGLDLTQRLASLISWLQAHHHVTQAFIATEEGLPLANDGTDEAYVALVAVIDRAIAETSLGARPFWGDLTLQIAPQRHLTVLHVLVGGERFALGSIAAQPLDESQRESIRLAFTRVFESNAIY